ncbi:succinate dehydrogenase, cytochrome b556 subunit [Aromatoleum toluclasticum]|uniref:succinate dehydrogenase, cytochrome b556 subunit n=1 Tax=Aromatoleum toluclasticum TaxID=92003 RepID=UPI00039EC498|nr:succinate dehydrogenase, cytochrome b556 subunit [Aromatoleum toluclasticum]
MARHSRRLPVFLNLAQIRFPIGAIASIAHRVAGVLLFMALPAVALLLDTSLRTEAGFAAVRDLLSSPFRVATAALLLWALVHHVLAGVRHLLMDVGMGRELANARASARLVLAAAPALTLFLVWGLT